MQLARLTAPRQAKKLIVSRIVRRDGGTKMDEQKNETGWTEVNPGIWKPEQQGDFIEGVYVNKEEGKGDFDSKLFFLDTKSGLQGVWGSAVLESRMNLVKVGEEVRIEFKGLEKNKKGQDVKIFKVLKKTV
jgi:hypothetical protein